MKGMLKVAGAVVCLMALWSPVRAAHDHALLPMMPSLNLYDYDEKDYDEYTIPMGPIVNGEASDVQKLEGKVTKILYRAPKTKSVLEIGRYYESLLKSRGFTVIFTGSGPSLGNWDHVFFTHVGALGNNGEQQRAFVAKLASGPATAYANIYISKSGDEAAIEVDVIQVGGTLDAAVPAPAAAPAAAPAVAAPVAAPAPAPVAVAPAPPAFLKQLVMKGRTIAKGIEFKEGSDELKETSEPVVAAIGNFLRQNHGIKLNVVCYTDSVGTPEYCKQLSEGRATTVVNTLVMMHGIESYRLSSKGMGWVSQADANQPGMSEAAYGNRIELVVMP